MSKIIEEALDSMEELQNTIEKERVTKKVESEKISDKLTVRQDAFCRLYALDSEVMGNGVYAYMKVYDVDKTKTGWYHTAGACASRMLNNAKIIARINELLETEGLNDSFIDKQLLHLATQHEDKNVKLGAIREYNKIKQRIIDRTESRQIIEVKQFDHIDKLLNNLK